MKAKCTRARQCVTLKYLTKKQILEASLSKNLFKDFSSLRSVYLSRHLKIAHSIWNRVISCKLIFKIVNLHSCNVTTCMSFLLVKYCVLRIRLKKIQMLFRAQEEIC